MLLPLEAKRNCAMITCAQAAREELAVGWERFHATFLHTPFGMALATIDGRFTYVNPAFCGLMGCTERELLAQDFFAVMHPEDRQDSRRQLRQLEEGKVTSVVLEKRYLARCREATRARASISAVPGENGETDHLVILFEEIGERKLTGDLLEYQALHDSLTGLANRGRLWESLDAAIALARARSGTVALLWIDLDRFKDINDTFGHNYGDQILKQLNPRLWAGLRETDLVARLGGDEFAILLPGVERQGAVLVAERVRAELCQPMEINGYRVDLGASIGIALFPEHAHDTESLMQRADVAMHAAKRSRMGQAVYALGQSHSTPRRLELVADLRRGIEDGQLLLYYQPKIDLKSGRVIGAEALVRWRHPRDGLIPPDLFIPLAEQTGLIRQLGLWVLESALARCADWAKEGLDLSIAVNLAADSLQDPRLDETVAAMLRRSGVPPGRLTLEVTESAMMADPARARDVLDRVHEVGAKVAIDDFGTGYSSLAYLKDLPVDEVKIDQKFVRGMRENPKDACIVRSVVDLGHNFGLRVVAEGAEDQESADLLTSWGCDVAQGYLFSKPLSPSDFRDWLSERGGRFQTIASLPAPALGPSTPAATNAAGTQPDPASGTQNAGQGALASNADRRRAVRYDTRDTSALIAWVDADQAHKVTTSLKNISADGAQVETDYEPLPARGTVVLFRLVSHVSDWVVNAKVADVRQPTRRAPRRLFALRKQPETAPGTTVHLEFQEPCPYEIFKASIAGFVVARGSNRQ
jgi:diguanylate cyclase (GGDEF)-like protein/PAS domain S-box-containing protein